MSTKNVYVYVYGSRAGSSAILSYALRPAIRRQQHIPLSKEQAAARYPVTLDFAGGHPAINGTDLHPTQLRDFALRQKLFARGAFVPHDASPTLYLYSAIRRPGRRVAQRALLHWSSLL